MPENDRMSLPDNLARFLAWAIANSTTRPRTPGADPWTARIPERNPTETEEAKRSWASTIGDKLGGNANATTIARYRMVPQQQSPGFDFSRAAQGAMPMNAPTGNIYSPQNLGRGAGTPNIFAAPGVAQALLAQPSQSAAANTPGRAAIEGAAPSYEPARLPTPEEFGLNPLSQEAMPIPGRGDGLRPEPNTEPRGDFDLSELMKVVGEPEKKGDGMSAGMKALLALGGLGLALGLRNQYKKDKGTTGKNTNKMLGMIAGGLQGYASYAQGQESKKAGERALGMKVALELAKQEAKNRQEQAKLDAAMERTQAGLATKKEIFGEAQADRNYWNEKEYALHLKQAETADKAMETATSADRHYALQQLESQAIEDRRAGRLTSPDQIDPMLARYKVSLDTIDAKIRREDESGRLREQQEFGRAISTPMDIMMLLSLMNSGSVRLGDTGPYKESLGRWLGSSTEPEPADYQED
jgi:hypothetical protein